MTFIPRDYPTTVNVNLLNEETEAVISYDDGPTTDQGYMSVSIEGEVLEEADNFKLTVSDLTGNIIYYGKVFVTAQTDLENYNSNEDLLTV